MPTEIGQRYGNLTVIKQTATKPGITYWEMKCDCGKTLEVAGRRLTQGRVTSCGCVPSEYCGSKLKPGMKVNRLTAISYTNGKWRCICDCGEYTELITNKILSGNTQSCGCLQAERVRETIKQVHEGNRKLEPKLASAKKRWGDYTHQNDLYISFEEFLDITSKNCVYCGVVPLQCWNAFTKKKNASQYSRDNGDWYYNGIDRIDNNVGYVKSNCCTACFQCNNAKTDQSREEFLARVPKYTIQSFSPLQWGEKETPSGSLGLSIWMAYKKHFDDADITIENFYWSSSLPCFYCGDSNIGHLNFASYDTKSSQKAKDNGDFHYNGLDRIYTNKGHTKDNVVPCCKYCNWAKLDQSLEEFQSWMKRIQTFQLTNPTILPAEMILC